MTYLSRYLQGAYVQVWQDLSKHSWREIEQEPLYSDTLSVARETMGRVRVNVLTLSERLQALGYQFGYGWLEAEAVARRERGIESLRRVYSEEPEELEEVERLAWNLRTLPPPLNEQEKDWVADQPPLFAPPLPDLAERLATLEQYHLKLPLSLRAFYEVIGSVNFVGMPPTSWTCDPVELDPLRVDPLDDGMLQLCLEEPEESRLWVAPDNCLKYNRSGAGSYVISLLEGATADSQLEGLWLDTSFVAYLRLACAWGGFPGMKNVQEPPEHDLAVLTTDLLPF
jgi:hypothetical protein